MQKAIGVFPPESKDSLTGLANGFTVPEHMPAFNTFHHNLIFSVSVSIFSPKGHTTYRCHDYDMCLSKWGTLQIVFRNIYT